MNYTQIFDIIETILILFGVLPFFLTISYSLAKDGFIETFKKIKNFNK